MSLEQCRLDECLVCVGDFLLSPLLVLLAFSSLCIPDTFGSLSLCCSDADSRVSEIKYIGGLWSASMYLYLWVWLASTAGSIAGKCDDMEVTVLETCKLSLQAQMKPENKPLICFLNIAQGTGTFVLLFTRLRVNLLEGKHKCLLPSLQGGCKALPECLDEIKYVLCYCVNFLITCSSGHFGFGITVYAWLLCNLSSNLSPALPQAFLCWGSVTNPTRVDMVWASCHAHDIAWHASRAPVCHVPVSMLIPLPEHHQIRVSWSAASPGLIFMGFKPVFSTSHNCTQASRLWTLLSTET